MRTFNEIKSEVNQLAEKLTLPLPEDPHEIATRLSQMSEMLATSGRLVAQTKYYLNVKRGEQAELLSTGEGKKATLMKELLARACAGEQYIVDLTDRVNATITHQIEIARSLLSWEKQYLLNMDNGEQGKGKGSRPINVRRQHG